MGEMLLSIHGSDGEQISRDDPSNGGTLTILRLHQKTTYESVWLECNIQFRTEMAASDDQRWTCGNPWQYVARLPGLSATMDPFEMSELDEQQVRESGQDWLQ